MRSFAKVYSQLSLFILLFWSWRYSRAKDTLACLDGHLQYIHQEMLYKVLAKYVNTLSLLWDVRFKKLALFVLEIKLPPPIVL